MKYMCTGISTSRWHTNGRVTTVRYFITSNDSTLEAQWEDRLRDHGYDVIEEYDSEAIIVTLGGDGSILYAARQYDDPTILPVRTGNSKGCKTVVEHDQLLPALERIEDEWGDGTYPVTEYGKLAAYRDGAQLQGEFVALNEINLHHASPVLAVIFDVRVRDRGTVHEFERVSGDGVVVATPFGSTAYYRAITGGTFTDGIGIAFNNVHTPLTTPDHLVVSSEAVVELEVVEAKRASGAVLTRDNVSEMVDVVAGEPVNVRQTGETIELLQSPLPVE